MQKGRRDILRKYSKAITIAPFDKTKRQQFLKARAEYKKICRKAEKAYRHHLTDKLMKIGQNDPKSFWIIINRMNNWGKKQIDPAYNIPIKNWINHF